MAYRFAQTPAHSYLETTSPPNWHATDYFSVSVWARTLEAANLYTLFHMLHVQGDGGKRNEYTLQLVQEGSVFKPRWAVYQKGTLYYLDSTTTWATSNTDWHNVVAAADRDGGYIYLSVDGETPASKGSVKFPETAITTFRVSGTGTTGRAINGEIAEVGLYDCNLAASAYGGDRAALVKGFVPARLRPANLLAYWPLVRGLQDHVGGHTLTAYNDPVVAEHCRVIP
ncbi:MAG TPA: hypothetical protein PLM14_06110 [Candidatus Hydrogenedentes bacterium]|nr:hypothetical protein [Candidatus Hydrogenedentota bacterium]